MPIARMDHFTILTTNAEKTVAFYNDMLGFTSGPRPAFSFPGAWLYNDGKAVLHVVQRPSIPDGGGVLDHIAFWGTDPSAYVAKLKARGIKYDLRRLPENGHAAGLGNCFFSTRAARGSRSTSPRARQWKGRDSACAVVRAPMRVSKDPPRMGRACTSAGPLAMPANAGIQRGFS